MARPWRYFLFLLWLAYLIVASILLFTRGFLLSRVTQTTNSTCIPYSITSCSFKESLGQHCSEDDQSSIMNLLHSASHICLPPRARVVLIIIDALRHDFTVFDPANKEPLAFQNKLPVMHDLLKTHPSSTRLYKFVADPPTTTMQRLKALTTGSLPTFIDAGSNFATAEINEDNIIDQLVKQMRDIVFMGDDTWVSLYPNRFAYSYPFPSFNVFDLDTVDTGIVQNLYSELEKKDWSLLIGHFLGVDHCGHRYGPTHPEMTRKLTEMNQVIVNIVERLDNTTMLIVIGDHGMTGTGDHGGESTDEVTSAMFVHSKINLITPDASIRNDTIKQVDLVPTLATILGTPIPHSNLGSLVIGSLPVCNKTQMPFPEWQTLLFAVWSNIQQMTGYIKEYAVRSETFSQERLQNLYEKFALLNARVRTIGSENEFTMFAKDAREYMVMLRQMCEEVWIQFDSFSMSRGLLLIFISIFLIYMIVSGIPSSQLPEIFMSSFLPCSYAVCFIAAGVSAVCFYCGLVDNLLSTIFFSTGIVSVVMLAILVIQNWDVIAIHWYDLSKYRTNMDLMCRLIFLLSWCGLLSNSYIVEEGYVSLFLLASILFIIINEHSIQKKPTGTTTSASNPKPKWNWAKIKLLSATVVTCTFVRITTIFWRCREEQQWCAAYLSAHTQGMKPGSKSDKAAFLVTLLIVAVFVTVTRDWLRSCGNLVGFSPSVFLMRYAPTVMVVATGGYWALHGLPKDTKTKLMAGWQIDYLAWIVYFFVSAGIVSIIFKPLCVYLIPDKKDMPASSEDNLIPQLFNRVKGLFNEKCSDSDSNVPVVCGLATVYSATFVALSVYVCLLFVLLLGDVVSPSAVSLYFAATVVLAITSMSRHEKAITTVQLFDVPNSCILAWMLLSLYFFYASGHQATFPNIPWEAAFVGTGGIFTNNFIPASLVIINTFGCYILMGLTFPLLYIAPFTLYIMFPSWCTKKNDGRNSQKDLSRGEILLYENDGVMLNGMFVASCKYILCHAFRVFISMLAATIHCRHLMVWKIFAPKLIFEAIGMLVTLASVLLGYLLLMRINHQVNSLVKRLNKKNR